MRENHMKKFHEEAERHHRKVSKAHRQCVERMADTETMGELKKVMTRHHETMADLHDEHADFCEKMAAEPMADVSELSDRGDVEAGERLKAARFARETAVLEKILGPMN